MFGSLFGKKTTRNMASSGPRRGFQPQIEALEDRRVMTSLATLGTVTTIATPVIPTSWLMGLPPAQAVNLTVEPHDQVAGILASKTTALYSFELQQGDYLQAELFVKAPLTSEHVSAAISILNANGTALKTSLPGTPYGFYAPASGTYYAEVSGSVTGILLAPPEAYQLDLHRLALSEGTQSASILSATGSMYAWLSGNTLNITGPTGYGFGITGNWTETTTTTNGLVTATYTATGTLHVQTASGVLVLGIASGQVGTLSTAAQINGQVFGAISSMNIPVTMNTGPTVTWLAGQLGFFNLNPLDENVTFDLKIGGAAGIGLGSSTVLHNTQAPVNNAVPYLYFTINPLGTTFTNVLSIVCDPADPAVYVEAGLPGIPLGVGTFNGFGYSQRGLIPYTPVDAPSQYTGSLASGNLVIQGSINTTALTIVPSKVAGNITFNFDPKGTGSSFGGASVSAAEIAGIFSLLGTGEATTLLAALNMSSSSSAQAINQVFSNFSVGINGTLEINPLEDFNQWWSWGAGNAVLSLPTGPSSVLDQTLNYILSGIGNPNSLAGNPQNLALLPVGDASLIYDGPTDSLYFRGGTTNPFATYGLTSLTPLYNFLVQTGMVPTFNLDGAVKAGGEVFLNFTTTGMGTSSQVLFAHDYPVIGPATQYLTGSTTSTGLPIVTKGSTPALYTGIYLDAKVGLLGNYVNLQGEMAGNGYFTLQASAQVNLGGLTGSAVFTLSDTAQGFSFTADLDAGFSSSCLRGNLDVQLSLGIADGHFTYAGSVEASGQVYCSSLFGWQGASLGGGISGDEIWVSADGFEVEFAL
jgi:hypothetical protein